MKIAIMQPYIFPYIGYFQLIKAVDKFIFYDDVNFIKQGWVNRNRILLNGADHLFSLPLIKQSSYTRIADTRINQQQYQVWKKKFYKTLSQTYKRAPFFDEVYMIVESVLESDFETIAAVAKNSIQTTCRYLNVDKQWVDSSSIYENDHLKAQDRVLDICKCEKATTYINPVGGMNLYSRDDFAKCRLQLHFIKSKNIEYNQQGERFVPGLSIIDVMMFNDPSRIQNQFLIEYQLI